MAASKKRQSADLFPHFLDFIHRHVSPGQHLLLGLSGGLDSCVLFDLLVRAREHFDFQLSAIHVNHRISPNADDWASFCEHLCASHGVPCLIVPVSVPRDSGLGIEAAARAMRYSAISSCHEDVVLFAHHRNDQAETLMLQMLRGAGVHGLAAMPVVGRMNGGKTVLRPLLSFARSQLDEYAVNRNLNWVEDESNDSLDFERNFLRHHVFPGLGERYPALVDNLARSASNLGEAAELLDDLAVQDSISAIHDGRVNIQWLQALGLARAKNLLRWWVKGRTGLAPAAAKLAEMMKQVDARIGAQICVDLEKFEFRRHKGWLYLEPKVMPSDYVVQWSGDEAITLPDGGVLTFKQVVGAGVLRSLMCSGVVTIQSRRGGEQFQPEANRPRKTLKNLFQDAEVPAWLRKRVPLVYIDQQLVFVPLLGIGYDCEASKDELGVLIEWDL